MGYAVVLNMIPGSVVRKIFTLRFNVAISYEAISTRLEILSRPKAPKILQETLKDY